MKEEGDPNSAKKPKKKATIRRKEFVAAAKDLDLLKTLKNLKAPDEELGAGLRELQYSMQQETGAKEPPPRSSVHKKIQRLQSAKLVRPKVRRIPPTELPRYRGWRVKRKEETKEAEIAENGKIEVQYGFELTARGKKVAEFIEDHVELNQSENEQEDESGDNME